METTININKEIFEEITFAAGIKGKSRTEIIVILLKKVMHDRSNIGHICRSIKYQDSDRDKNWHIFHLTLKANEYEYFLDLRKLLKMSLSLIVAYAVKKYLKSIIDGDCTDNYTFQNYILAKEDVDGVIYWMLFWGVPRNLEQYITFKDCLIH